MVHGLQSVDEEQNYWRWGPDRTAKSTSCVKKINSKHDLLELRVSSICSQLRPAAFYHVPSFLSHRHSILCSPQVNDRYLSPHRAEGWVHLCNKTM